MRAAGIRRLAAGGAAIGILALTGCTSQVHTDIRVTGADQATVHVSAIFTDEASGQIRANPATRNALLGVFSDRTGRTPQVSESDGRLAVSDDLTYDQLKAAGSIVGVTSMALSGSGDDVTLTAHLVPATKLVAAITQTNASQPDAAALTETMLKSTHVIVSVTFPGGVKNATGADVTVAGATATVDRTADATGATTLTVTGDPTPNRAKYYLGGAGALVAVVGGLLGWRRRR